MYVRMCSWKVAFRSRDTHGIEVCVVLIKKVLFFIKGSGLSQTRVLIFDYNDYGCLRAI